MRTLTDHAVNETNEALQILVTDEPGAGGANHRYVIQTLPQPLREELRSGLPCEVNFQNGPIKESGVNGVTQEALLAIVIDRLRSFQAGPYACKSNADALAHVETGLEHLKARTRERLSRGVEGTHAK